MCVIVGVFGPLSLEKAAGSEGRMRSQAAVNLSGLGLGGSWPVCELQPLTFSQMLSPQFVTPLEVSGYCKAQLL